MCSSGLVLVTHYLQDIMIVIYVVHAHACGVFLFSTAGGSMCHVVESGGLGRHGPGTGPACRLWAAGMRAPGECCRCRSWAVPEAVGGVGQVMEDLEQLKVLENGHKIKVIVVDHKAHGVDEPQDVPVIEAKMRALGLS